VREGRFASEVPVNLIETDSEWSLYFSLRNAEHLECVRAALGAGDFKAVSALATVYELTPVLAP
jgi:hypothetical protein